MSKAASKAESKPNVEKAKRKTSPPTYMFIVCDQRETHLGEVTDRESCLKKCEDLIKLGYVSAGSVAEFEELAGDKSLTFLCHNGRVKQAQLKEPKTATIGFTRAAAGA